MHMRTHIHIHMRIRMSMCMCVCICMCLDKIFTQYKHLFKVFGLQSKVFDFTISCGQRHNILNKLDMCTDTRPWNNIHM